MRANDIAIHQKQKDEDVSYQLKVTVRQWTMSKTNNVKHVIKKKPRQDTVQSENN